MKICDVCKGKRQPEDDKNGVPRGFEMRSFMYGVIVFKRDLSDKDEEGHVFDVCQTCYFKLYENISGRSIVDTWLGEE